MRARRIIGLAFVILLVLPACSFAKQPGSTQKLMEASAGKGRVATYPAALIGQWEPGPDPCKLPLTYDSDGGLKIAARMLQGYEHADTPKKVKLISDAPKAWRIEAMEAYGGDRNPVVDIYVLSGDYLTVTDGERSTTYNRCR